MSSPGGEKQAIASASVSPEELVRLLNQRGLIDENDLERIRDRLKALDANRSPNGAVELLKLLHQEGLLTASQARRVAKELLERPAGVPRHLPGYELLELIGRGSMGVVFKARQLSMDRIVAVKILRRELASNKEFIERFHREAKIAAKLSHNNIVQAIDSGEYKGYHYFVMEYVDGTNIREELEKGKVYEEKEALEIILQVAEALDHAYRRGLVHRDIKPENIMLTKEGVPKLADLGLARLSEGDPMAKAEKGIAIGTPYYISPEQIRGQVDIDIRADIYSLGATLYHMVTGRVPFPGKDPVEVMKKHLHEPLVPPDHINPKLSSGLGEVVEKMMAKRREERYQTPEEVITDLKRLLAGEPPLLARQQINMAVLAQLEEHGTPVDAAAAPLTEAVAHKRLATMQTKLAFWQTMTLVFGLLFAGSLILNLILILSR